MYVIVTQAEGGAYTARSASNPSLPSLASKGRHSFSTRDNAGGGADAHSSASSVSFKHKRFGTLLDKLGSRNKMKG